MSSGQSRKGLVTALDVARKAGVSVSTVSLALRGSGRISAKTIEQIREIASELNYLPNAQASSLRRRVTERIALVVPDIGNSVYVSMAKSIQRVAKERGYYVSLVSTDDIEGADIDALRLLKNGQVDGMILIALRQSRDLAAEIKRLDKPICVIGRVPGDLGVDNVRVDSQAGARLGAEHLLALGRRTIAFINGPADTYPAQARLKGYQEAMQQAGVPARVVGTEFTVAGGYQAVDQVLCEYPQADALLCANDLIGIGVLKRLRELGRRVPADLVVIGIDDIAECEICTPTLSSVALLAGERGKLAAGLLLDRIQGHAPANPVEVLISPRLVVRESTQGPQAAGETL